MLVGQGGSHPPQPSSPTLISKIPSTLDLRWISPRLLPHSLKDTPDSSALDWDAPLAFRDASLSSIFLKAKKILTWEGDTSNVKNSKQRKCPNSFLRQEPHRSCVDWADNRSILQLTGFWTLLWSLRSPLTFPLSLLQPVPLAPSSNHISLHLPLADKRTENSIQRLIEPAGLGLRELLPSPWMSKLLLRTAVRCTWQWLWLTSQILMGHLNRANWPGCRSLWIQETRENVGGNETLFPIKQPSQKSF